MPETYKAYTLNIVGEAEPWGARENTLFKNLLDKLPNEDKVLVTLRHTHDRLTLPTETLTSAVTVLASGFTGVNETTPRVFFQVSGDVGALGNPVLASNIITMFKKDNNVGVALISGAADRCDIEFGSDIDADSGRIKYDNNTESMEFYSNANSIPRIFIESVAGDFLGIHDPSPKCTLQVTDGDMSLTGVTADVVGTFVKKEDDCYIEIVCHTSQSAGIYFSSGIDTGATAWASKIDCDVTDTKQLRFYANQALAMTVFSAGGIGLGVAPTNASALDIRNDAGGAALGYITLEELNGVADAANPAANKAVIYARQNGAGGTSLYARFATGASVEIVAEP